MLCRSLEASNRLDVQVAASSTPIAGSSAETRHRPLEKYAYSRATAPRIIALSPLGRSSA
jgi:hypothetical protein